MEPDLQKLLVRLGYLTAAYKPGELDEATREAVRRFQELHALAPTGEPDEATLAALRVAGGSWERIIVGEVVDAVGPIKQAFISVKDRDLGEPANWPVLDSGSTDRDGRFLFSYTMVERGCAGRSGVHHHVDRDR